MLKIIFCIGLIVSQSVTADGFNTPESGHMNTNPFVSIHELPGYSTVNQVDSGKLETRLQLGITNEFHQQREDQEQLSFDFERTRLELNFQFGINDQYSLGLKIPYLSNSGGFLDNLIENWHDLFSLPQGGRDAAPADEFEIRYQGQNDQFFLDSTGSGLGDISVFVDRQLYRQPDSAIKARASVKFPTGNEEELFGSGGYSFFFSLNFAQQFTPKWHGFAATGVSYLQGSEILSAQQKDWVGTAVFGMGWQFNSRFSIAGQIDLNSRVYSDSRLDGIKGDGGVLYLAALYRFTNHSQLQLGFTEDIINKDAVPDFGIRLSYQF